jgi:23S rRNA (uracil1939-C5)-methyltransferase
MANSVAEAKVLVALFRLTRSPIIATGQDGKRFWLGVMQLTIERLGHQGDGIAPGPVFVPLALPGEVVEGDVVDGRMVQPKIVTASDYRQKPPCRHYRACGGCVVQHARDDSVAQWKIDIVRVALAAQGLDAPISGIATSRPGTRRRATLHGRRTKSGALVGFHGRASDLLTDVPDCLVLDAALLALLPLLHEITSRTASRKGEIDFALTKTDLGTDIAVSCGRDLSAREVADLAELCGAAKVTRLTWNGEPLASFAPSRVTLAGVGVDLPPGAFLQATPEGEAALVSDVRRHLSGAKRVADLFAGAGTFSLPLAASAEVLAVEGEAGLTDALERAVRASGLKPRLTVLTRDLFRQPLLAAELKGLDGVVIDPPRAGAEAQSREIARSDVPKIAAVSCNPATFARDARILTEGGYRLDEVRVIDQFRWSAHVELTALLTKA